jgi:hypothetical protein
MAVINRVTDHWVAIEAPTFSCENGSLFFYEVKKMNEMGYRAAFMIDSKGTSEHVHRYRRVSRTM